VGWPVSTDLIQRRLRDNEESAMPWTETDRVLYKPCAATYSTSLTDAEFAHVEPLLPLPGKRGRLKHGFRSILDAILYLVRSGIPWRLLPMDFPPFTSVQYWFYKWRDNGLLDQILCVLCMALREAEGRAAAATVVLVDSQSVKSTQTGSMPGFDAGKKIKGRKRHLAVDTLGLPIVLQVTPADVQDRDQLASILAEVHKRNPWVGTAFVDGGYNGDEALRAAFEASKIHCNVVKRSDKQLPGFVVLPMRWIVERTLGWVNYARRLSKDFEKTLESARAWLQIALIAIVLRRLARTIKAAHQP